MLRWVQFLVYPLEKCMPCTQGCHRLLVRAYNLCLCCTRRINQRLLMQWCSAGYKWKGKRYTDESEQYILSQKKLDTQVIICPYKSSKIDISIKVQNSSFVSGNAKKEMRLSHGGELQGAGGRYNGGTRSAGQSLTGVGITQGFILVIIQLLFKNVLFTFQWLYSIINEIKTVQK